ncbi:MAG: glucose 1-dehydrogenase [Bacteroidota bacterium]
MNQFTDQVALVTGAASGIGRATALAFAKAGAKVVVSDIQEAAGQETVASIEAAGGEASFAKTNVANQEEVIQLIRQTVEKYGRLDIGVNNAGIGGEMAKLAETSVDSYHKVMAVNVDGVFFGMQEQLKQMLAQGSGSIVNVSSVAGLRGLANSSAYTASKHAVLGLTKAASVEYARKNIRINAVCPVFTRSAMFDSMFTYDPSLEEKLKRVIPMRRYGQPEDIAQAILWLCSSESSFVTGQCISLDGGLTAQ